MKPVPFTQFLRPNGVERQITIGRPEPIAELAQKLIAGGCRLETEILSTGEISMTVELGEELLAIEIVHNGPEVSEAVDKLICDASRHFNGGKELQCIGDAFPE